MKRDIRSIKMLTKCGGRFCLPSKPREPSPVLTSKRTNTKFLSFALGFSAGVMINVSFVEIWGKAKESLVSALGEGPGNWITAGAFFAGMFLIAVIDKLVPSAENPHEARKVEELSDETRGAMQKKGKLMRMGVMSALAIAIHNFPEGLATFTAALKEPSLGNCHS